MNFQGGHDLMHICRVCLYKTEDQELQVVTTTHKDIKTNRQLQSIYKCPPVERDLNLQDTSQQIVELLKSIAPQLQIPTMDATLPQMICECCLAQLRQAHQFQQMCLDADSHIQQLLQCYYDAQGVQSMFSTSFRSADEDVLVLEDPLEAQQEATNYLKLEFDDVESMQEIVANVKVKMEAKSGGTVQFETDLKPNVSDEMMKQISAPKKPHGSNSPFTVLEIKDEQNLAASTSSSSCGSEQDSGERSEYIDLSNKKRFVRTNNPEGYKCDECPRRFAKQESLKAHIETTHDPNQYECDLCDKKFKWKRRLAKHRRRLHAESKEQQKQKQLEEKEALAANKANDNAKIHICEFCNKGFNQSCTLKDHLRIHTGEKPFLCSECGRGFNSSSNMKQHLLRHSGERRYECPVCPKKFPCLSDLASHRAVHNKLKSHVCDICGKAFDKPFQLKKHNMYHNGIKPHKCEYCEMRFVCADHMRRHMRTHTGEKPYKCKYCTRAFAQSNDLVKHLRSHLGENVYRCELCPSGFRLAAELRKHFAVHKSDDDATRLANLQCLMEEEAKLRLKIGGTDGRDGSRDPPISTAVA